jgi:putative endonuclease
MTYYVYILANRSNSVLYIGVTNSLTRRMREHKTHYNKGFTHRYNVTKLIYFEEFRSIVKAIAREKELKKWHRAWKFELIKTVNPRLLRIPVD